MKEMLKGLVREVREIKENKEEINETINRV